MDRPRIIVIGASAGGFEPLAKIVGGLPRSFDIPIAVVQHLPAGPSSLLPRLLADETRLPVFEAEDRTPLGPGIFTAPPGYHLLVESAERLGLSVDEFEEHCRPAINVLFESAVEVFESHVIGIALSCANRDGLEGMRRIHRAGGLTIVQNPSEALATCLPEAIVSEGIASLTLDSSDMSEAILKASRFSSARGSRS